MAAVSDTLTVRTGRLWSWAFRLALRWELYRFGLWLARHPVIRVSG